ncbi:Gfo/Idh/MocA family oxidoreductase [Streptomyces sp. A1499]|uniref:Gfo/Idh/MocA family protein n=1 Tax=Streptomyces sp. A1499 TaxID=2563104 RepID=UPI00109E678A|nr:Gfo/Idh/MocA family oxidoreductase [Streptomyces sp. A1499]THC51388.1 Gfo/Idh/MocA family oxidoreductase [Streptomyces sp. A1499]
MRWGIAGHGDIVTRRALPALRALGEEPAVLWGRDAHRAARVAERYGVPRSGADPGVLLRGVDAVYVATPVAAHVPLAAAALDAGLPVLVEKPLAGGLGSPGLGGGDLGRGSGPAWRCAGVAYYRRLAPAVRRLRAELRGWTPERVEVRFRCAFAPGPDDPMRWRTDPAVSGGGVLADAGSHRVDLLLHLFGRPLEVSARLTDRFPAGAERRADLTLRWPHGPTARCVMAWGEGAPVDRLELHGGGRTVTLDPLDEGRLTGLDVRGGGRLAGRDTGGGGKTTGVGPSGAGQSPGLGPSGDGQPVGSGPSGEGPLTGLGPSGDGQPTGIGPGSDGRPTGRGPSGEGRVTGLDVRGGGRLAGLGRGEEGVSGAGSGALLLPPFANPHQTLFADFAEAVGEGRAPVCPLAEGRLVDDVIVAAGRSSAAGGRPTPLRCT